MKSTVLAACGLVVFVGCADDDALDLVEVSEEPIEIESDAGAFQQGADGLVSIEAEHPHRRLARSDRAWNHASPTGSSGTAISADPNGGTLFDLDDLWFAPRIDFNVKFTQTGKHYLWIRGRGASGSDDSVHGGVDWLPFAPRISGFDTDWTWSNETMGGYRATIWVWCEGVHRVSLWMREDGFEVDKLVLTNDASYEPAGLGPDESPGHSCDSSGQGHGHDDCPEDPPVEVCGNGIVEGTESCDGGACCTAGCSFAPAADVCRGSAGDCDVAESCTGSSAACPDDAFVAAGTECRGSAGACDVAEACTGASGACPADGFVAAGTECRGSAGDCDAAEACTGAGVDCPADAYADAGTVCRASTGACDVAEVCDGSTLSCPSDGYANAPPVVSAGPDVEVPVTSGTATLAGTATDDGCPSSSLVVTWSVVGGPGVVTFADATAASTTATFSAGGVYELELSAYDEIQTVTDRVIVTVNIGPSADAGPNRIINQPEMQVTLFGSVSDDGIPAAGTLQTAWSVVSGPAGATFAPPDAQVTTVTFAETGTYVLRLTADDGAMTASDDVQVMVAPQPDLVVDAVVPPTLDGNTLDVSGTASAAVTNQGGTTDHAFAVTFFEDRDGNGTLDPAVDGVLGVGTHAGLASGETASVEAAVSGTVEFAGNVTYALADSGNELVESDETNNYGSSSPPCEAHGPSAPFTPDLERSWTAGTTLPASRQVQTTPMVADMNGDGVSDIVFTSHPDNAQTNANLRAIDGRTGAELFTTTDPANALSGIAQLAIGDIDLDGHPEVVAVSSNTQSLIAFEHDGTFKWKYALASPAVAMVWGGAAIADLDGDGAPEIIAGKTVVNADGTLRWNGAAGSGAYTNGPLTAVADLDLDGTQEVLAGNTAYRADGSILWNLAALPDGLAAVANFDADDNPEVVLAGSGRIWVLEHDGAIKWTSATTALGTTGGAVVIADFDGDGAVEIGRSGTTSYGVFETDGTLKWTSPIQDPNSGVTSSSAFDFDNDGAAEVVFADEWGLRVLDGATGAVKFEQRLGSCTGYENPVVADLDADGRAELIAVANMTCGIAGNINHGVFVFGNDAWVGSRAIYNQHTYHVVNVNDDASIPAHEDATTSFRRNAVSACPYLLPDLTASFLRVVSAGASYDLTIRIGNGGATPTPDGIPVTFYDGDPHAGGVPLGTASTSVYIAPGEFEDVTLTVPATPTTGTIWVAADDASDMIGTIYESDETNNLFDAGVGL